MTECDIINKLSGHLTVILGSMFSGKSTEIIRLMNRFKVLNKNIVAINHTLDDRYDGNNAKIITHDKVNIGCLKLDKLMPFTKTNEYIQAEVLVVEEGQFFEDLFDFVVKSVDIDNKRVIVAGLDGDYMRRCDPRRKRFDESLKRTKVILSFLGFRT